MKKEPLSIMIVKTLLAVIIFAGMGMIIIGGGYLIWERDIQIKPATEVVPVESFKDCSRLKNTERNDCYLNLAKENKDESFCEKISIIEFRSLCYTDLAILKNDPELCGKATASLASSCLEYFTESGKLVITYPNKDTVWKAGESYEIRWIRTPVNPKMKVDIKLTTNNATIVIAQSPVNFLDSGSYLFTVPKKITMPEKLKDRKKYQILVTSYISDGSFDSVGSEEFSIVSDKVEPEEIIEIDKTPSWPIYRNEELGFEITFTEVWKNYETIINRENEEIYVGFRRPTEGFGIITENSGYIRIFSIFPTKIAEWEEHLKFGGPGHELGRKDGYAFVFMGMNGDVPEDQEEAIVDLGKIIDSFKFIEK